MSLVRMHYARNEISDRSFQCLDLTFFQNDSNKPSYNPHEESKAAQNLPEEESKTHQAVNYAKLGQAMAGRLGEQLTTTSLEAQQSL
mmetsp:Transcript_35294/g.46466  ORF Transcript_35294/g.46466 Transcript_35294/m.46466 type:complete len:87 (+) Transcript_35294:1066-1326(+)